MDINEYLKQFDKFTKDPTLEAMYFLLDKFDNPQNKLKIIHIAGTNGKGSVCEMLNRILVDSGYTVGKFISPQLIKFNETITVNDEEISDEEISKILEKLSVYIDEYNSKHEIKVKWFEVITSVALIYFAQRKCDFAVIETGLGGTTDCTNVVESMISIIVSVGLDHVDILGNNIVDIAKHKDYKITLFYIFVDNYNVCLERIKNRVLKGGHNVPIEDVKRRYYRSIKNFKKYINKIDNWNLYYNTNEFPLLIAKSTKQDLVILNNKIYKLFMEIINE